MSYFRLFKELIKLVVLYHPDPYPDSYLDYRESYFRLFKELIKLVVLYHPDPDSYRDYRDYRDYRESYFRFYPPNLLSSTTALCSWIAKVDYYRISLPVTYPGLQRTKGVQK
jgi:hypothetical protein